MCEREDGSNLTHSRKCIKCTFFSKFIHQHQHDGEMMDEQLLACRQGGGPLTRMETQPLHNANAMKESTNVYGKLPLTAKKIGDSFFFTVDSTQRLVVWGQNVLHDQTPHMFFFHIECSIPSCKQCKGGGAANCNPFQIK